MTCLVIGGIGVNLSYTFSIALVDSLGMGCDKKIKDIRLPSGKCSHYKISRAA